MCCRRWSGESGTQATCPDYRMSTVYASSDTARLRCRLSVHGAPIGLGATGTLCAAPVIWAGDRL